MPSWRSWSGTLFLGEGWMVYAGPLGPTQVHAHHAVQVIVADGDLAVLGPQGLRTESKSIVVPANVAHTLDAIDVNGCVAYLDPLRVDLAGDEVRADLELPIPPDLLAVADAAGWVELVTLACGGRVRSAATTELVARVMEVARRRLPAVVRLGDVVEPLGYSTSTVTHRFTSEVGIPFRRWVLWERLQLAADAVRQGGNLTVAAHSAGFADSAHLNRTFRRMFGIAPTELVGAVGWEVEPRPDRSSR